MKKIIQEKKINRHDKNKTKKEYFTHTIEQNLAIAIKKNGGYAKESEIATLLGTDEVSAKMALTLLLKHKNATLVDGEIKLDEIIYSLLNS